MITTDTRYLVQYKHPNPLLGLRSGVEEFEWKLAVSFKDKQQALAYRVSYRTYFPDVETRVVEEVTTVSQEIVGGDA